MSDSLFDLGRRLSFDRIHVIESVLIFFSFSCFFLLSFSFSFGSACRAAVFAEIVF
jgi:hypothetical protein